MIRSPAPLVAAVVALAGCSDLGTDPVPPPDGGSGTLDVMLDEVVPVRTVIGDEVQVRGLRFGDTPGDRVVEFEGAGGPTPAMVIAWALDPQVLMPRSAKSALPLPSNPEL